MNKTMYPVSCVTCGTYTGDFSTIKELENSGMRVLEDTGHISEVTAICSDCDNIAKPLVSCESCHWNWTPKE